MSSPLVDSDVNSRPPGFKSIRTSRIPNLRMVNNTGSTARRSPFSVSTTGSPRYTAMSPPSRTTKLSPAVTSKIPRMGQTPTQAPISKVTTHGNGAIQQRYTLSRSYSECNVPTAISPSHMEVKKLSPSSVRDKPLPSPPIAQVIDPNSPLKAQRTLVDAEAGSPTDEEWPILRPENVSPDDQPVVPQQHIASEVSKIRQHARVGIKTRTTEPSVTLTSCVEANTSPFSSQSAETGGVDVMQTTSRGTGSKNPYVSTFHAISTGTEVATESPLSQKESAPIFIPPRISSKHNSLPLLNDDASESSTLLPFVMLRHTKSAGSTKWPVLEAKDDDKLAFDRPSSSLDQQVETLPTSECPPRHSQEHLHNIFEPVGGCHTIQPQYGSIDNNSTCNMAARLSPGDELHNGFENSIRIKRLSWHSTTSGKGSVTKTGPVLMIDGDADIVLFGSNYLVPDIPALPERTPEQVLPLRSPSALTERVPKQTMAKVALENISRTSTLSSTKNGTAKSSFAKIDPIRSMQPPRKGSVETFIYKSSSPIEPKLTESDKASKLPMFSSISKRNTSGFSKKMKTTMSKSTLTRAKSSLDCNLPDQPANNVREEIDNNPDPGPHTSSGIDQGLSTGSETPPVPLQSKLRDSLFSPDDDFGARKEDKSCNKTGPLLPTERTSSRTSAFVLASSPKSLIVHDSAHPITEPHSPGLSKLDIISSSMRCRELSVVERQAPSNSTKQSPQSILVSSSFTLDENLSKIPPDGITKIKNGTLKKIKAKRSFRDVFHRREVKSTEKPPKPTEAKQSSMAGNIITKRFMNSANVSKVHNSKVHKPRTPESRAHPEHESASKEIASKSVTNLTERQASISLLEGDSFGPVTETLPLVCYDTATVINKIITRVTSIPSDSPDRLRGVEIAEAVLHAIECSKEAKISAEMAKTHARDAELNAERASVELRKLQTLCELDFDGETLTAIKSLIQSVGLVSGK